MDRVVGRVRDFLSVVGYLTAFLVLTLYGVTEYDLRNNSSQERIHSSTVQVVPAPEPRGRIKRR